MEPGIALAVGGLAIVALAAAVGPRLKIPAPLILVLLGIGVSLLPFVPQLVVPPELVLAGILPPLLYSASVSLPAMDLRRDFGAISVLSVVLVVVSALVLGSVFTVLVPGLQYGWAVALGAVISPTDAVATSIVRETTVSRRVTAILDGEGLLNDASALVLLRAAIASSAVAVSAWGVVSGFVLAVVVAGVIGFVVGHLGNWVRAHVTSSTVNTVLSFTIPFAASLPAEALRGSGLVAAVVAGLVVGRDGPRVLRPEHRRSDEQNWATVSLVLEGSIFLLMGLEIPRIVRSSGGLGVAAAALGLAAVALACVLAVRALFLVPLLGWLRLRSGQAVQARDGVEGMRIRLLEGKPVEIRGRPVRRRRPIDAVRLGQRLQSVLAGIDYLAASRLGPREGAVLVWAGMRGAVTVAAVQTLPTVREGGPPEQPLLVLIAFGVASISLLVQGGSLFLLIRVLRPITDDPSLIEADHRAVLALVHDFAEGMPAEPGESAKEHRLKQLQASRAALLDARDLGMYDAGVLGGALAAVDSEQITLQLQGGPQG